MYRERTGGKCLLFATSGKLYTRRVVLMFFGGDGDGTAFHHLLLSGPLA